MGEFADNKNTNRNWLAVSSILYLDGINSKYAALPYRQHLDFSLLIDWSISFVYYGRFYSEWTNSVLLTNVAGPLVSRGISIMDNNDQGHFLMVHVKGTNTEVFANIPLAIDPNIHRDLNIDLVTLSYDRGTKIISVYVGKHLSGTLDCSSITGSISSGLPWQIGRMPTRTGNVINFRGGIGLLAFFCKALTAADVADRYNEIGIINKSLQVYCIGFLPCQETSGSKLYDMVGQFNPGKPFINYQLRGTTPDSNSFGSVFSDVTWVRDVTNNVIRFDRSINPAAFMRFMSQCNTQPGGFVANTPKIATIKVVIKTAFDGDGIRVSGSTYDSFNASPYYKEVGTYTWTAPVIETYGGGDFTRFTCDAAPNTNTGEVDYIDITFDGKILPAHADLIGYTPNDLINGSKYDFYTKQKTYTTGIKGVGGSTSSVNFNASAFTGVVGATKVAYYIDFISAGFTDFVLSPGYDGVNCALRMGGRYINLNGIVKGLSGVKNMRIGNVDGTLPYQYPLNRRTRILLIFTDGQPLEAWASGVKLSGTVDVATTGVLTSPNVFYNWATPSTFVSMSILPNYPGAGMGDQLNEHCILNNCTLTDDQKQQLTAGTIDSISTLATQSRVHHVHYGNRIGNTVYDLKGSYDGTIANFPSTFVMEANTGLPELNKALKFTGTQYIRKAVSYGTGDIATFFLCFHLAADQLVSPTNEFISFGDGTTNGNYIALNISNYIYLGAQPLLQNFTYGFNMLYVCCEKGKGTTASNMKTTVILNGAQTINNVIPNIPFQTFNEIRFFKDYYYNSFGKGSFICAGFGLEKLEVSDVVNINKNTLFTNPSPYLRSKLKIYITAPTIDTAGATAPNYGTDGGTASLLGFTSDELNPAQPNYAIIDSNGLR